MAERPVTRPLAFTSPGRYEVFCHSSPQAPHAEEAYEALHICVPLERAVYTVTLQSEVGSTLRQRLGSRDVLVVPASQSHTVQSLRHADIVWLHLSREFLEDALEVQRLNIPDAFTVRDSLVSLVAKELRTALRTEGRLTGLFAETAVTMIAARVVAPGIDTKPVGSRRIAPLRPRQLAVIQDYVDAHLEDPISAADLSAMLGLSTWHFMRRFHSTVGLSPHDFVVQCRLERAQHLLRNTTESIMDVALEVGMTHSHLSRVFVAKLGLSPREFRVREREG